MDERQRQFAQFASALNQFAAGNAQGAVDRGHRDRPTNDGRSSTGSTSSGSSSIISNNGNNVAAAVAAVAAGGSAAVWGELNRALQYGYPPFSAGASWPPSQGGAEFHRLANFANYGEGGNDGRSPDGRLEGRRVPSKGETKATPPLPPGLAPSRGSTLASLQQLVNLPNEDVYRLIAAQQYAAALSVLPTTSRAQVSPGPNASHSSISPGQMHPNIHSRHQNVDYSMQYNQQYSSQQRYRQPVRNLSPLSNTSSAADRPQASPSPDNASINGDYMEPVRRSEERLSPEGLKCKELLPQPGHIRVSPNLMPIKVAPSNENLPIHPERSYPYDNEPQSSNNSRISDGLPSGSDSDGDQKSRHRRKQHQPRRQTVIYGSANQPMNDMQQITPNSVDSGSDDSEDCGMMMVNHAEIPPPALSSTSEHHNPVTSMSSAMSHALSHPFLAPHLNQPDRKFENPIMEPVEKKLLNTEMVNPTNLSKSDHNIVSDPKQSLGSTSTIRIPDLIPCNPSSLEVDDLNSVNLRTKKTNCVSNDYCTPVKKRKLSQPSDDPSKSLKSENHSENCEAVADLHPGTLVTLDCDSKKGEGIETNILDPNVILKPEEVIEGSKNESFENTQQKGNECKLVNGDHILKDDELISPTKLSDLSDDYYDCSKRRMRQKRPISYVEDETDPVLETNEDALPLCSPTRRRGRRSKDKIESDVSPIRSVSFPSISVSDASLYEQPSFGGGRKLLQNIPEKVKEPLHIDTNVAQSSPPCSNQYLGMQIPDIYDFNDTDGEYPERQQKKRGRKRGSPKKTDRSPVEFIRSSPRKVALCSPKFFPSTRSPEIIGDKKDNSKRETMIPFPHRAVEDINFPTVGPLTKAELNRSPTVKEPETIHSLEQINNNYGKKEYEPYTTISPTKLASLCQEPVEQYSPNRFHINGPYRNNYGQHDNAINDACKNFSLNCNNNNRTKKKLKRRKRGRPKGCNASPMKDSLMHSMSVDPLMLAGKEPLSNIPMSEQTVNVSMAQFPSPRSRGRGRRKKRSYKSRSPENNVQNSNISSPSDGMKNRTGRNTQNSLSSLPDISQPSSISSTKINIDEGSAAKDNKSKAQNPELDCGETMEDIEQFLKETAPSNESSPIKSDYSNSTITTTPNTSNLSIASTSETNYRESRPKRISRPPPELPEGEMNDLLLLLNMDDEESDDEDYVPREFDDHGSDSRLSLTDIEDESDSNNIPSRQSPTYMVVEKYHNEAVKEKVDKNIAKKKYGKKVVQSNKKEELKKKIDEKCDRRGPYVRLSKNGGRDVIVNNDRDNNDTENNIRKVAIPFHVDKEVKNVKVGFNSTLHPNYNAFTKDMSWYCAFCKMYSHHCALGDLFGPYFINSSSPSKKNYPTVTEGQVEETVSSPEEAASRYRVRRTPRSDGLEFENKKSEVWESPPMRFVPSATPARMLGRAGAMRTPERGNLNSPRLMPGSTAGTHGQKSAAKFGKDLIAHKAPSESKRPPGTECWFHAACLVWSSGITVVNSRLLGLDETVISAQDSLCSHCKESGATVCCLRRGCQLTVHVPCARVLRWSLDEELFLSHCPLHIPSKTHK